MSRETIELNTGGQFLVQPIGSHPVFSRESFSEEHREIEKMVINFAKERIYPNVLNIDKFNKKLTLRLMKEIGELGLLGADIPEEYGGMNLDKITSAIVMEGLCRGGSASFGVTSSVQTSIGSMGIVWFGTKEQKEKFLPDLVTGEKIASYALTEPSAGSDATSGKTTAILSEDGKYYILNGEKIFITNGGWSDVFTVLVQVDGDKFSGILVEKGTEGFEIGAEEKKMGMKGSSTTSLKFTDCKVPVENLLYEVGKGTDIAFNALNIGRYKLAASCLGGAKTCIEETIKYINERRQFGQAIANFDAIRGKVADMTIRIYCCDSMTYRTIGLIQNAIDELDPAAEDYYIQMGKAMGKYAIEVSMAKIYGSDTSDEIIDTGLQCFGGYGFIEEYPMAMAYRDDRINSIWEGTNEINRMIITGFLMKKALMDELDVRAALDGLDDFLNDPENSFALNSLQDEARAIEAGKRLALLIFNEAICEFGQDLKHLQQLGDLLADAFTLLYAGEATICRVNNATAGNGQSLIPPMIAQVNTIEACQEIITKLQTAIRYLFPSGATVDLVEKIKKLESAMNLDTDTISLKQEIAHFMVKQTSYPF